MRRLHFKPDFKNHDLVFVLLSLIWTEIKKLCDLGFKLCK